MAVDQRVAEHGRTHAAFGGVEHERVDRHARRLVGRRCGQVVLGVDFVRCLAARRIADDARSARMEKRLAGAGESLDQGLDRTAIVAARRIDHGIRGLGLGGQQRGIVERADHGLDAEPFECRRLFGSPDQATHMMARANHAGRNGAADKTACTGDEDVHKVLLLKLDHGKCVQYQARRLSQKAC